MTIEPDKQKALFTHKLEIRKLIYDKVLFGLIILVIGFMANLLIEQYRSKSIKDRFILEKRLEAVQNISRAYMKMHNAFDNLSLQTEMDAGDHYLLENVTQEFISDWTEWGIILSGDFRSKLDYLTWIYIGLGSYSLPELKKYRPFLIELYYKFISMCNQELGFSKTSGQPSFQFVEWSVFKADTLGAQAFLEANYQKWLQLKNKRTGIDKTGGTSTK